MKLLSAFSVIIPVYNNCNTLEKAIESVLSQTFPPQEILVVDDGSTDGSAERAQHLFKDKIRLIKFPENKGPAAARNAGIRAATGTHLAFLDADDTWHPEKLERIRLVLEAFPKALLVFHDYTLFPEIPGNSVSKAFPFYRFLVHNPVATPCAVVRQTMLRFDEQLRWMEDYDYFLRHAETGMVYYLPQALTTLGRPILSAGGQSSRRWQMRKAEGKVIWHFCRRRPAFFLLLPFWVIWLLAKHGLQETRRALRGS